MVVSSSSGLVVGATIQGTGIPTGAKIGTLAGTTVTMVNNSGNPVNATVGGAQNLLFSSVYGTTLTVSLSGGTDYATPQNIYDAGFGVMSDNIARREIFFPGGLTITWSNIVAGAVFDFLNWSLEFGSGGRWQFEGASILGELRGGYLVNGTQFMKTAGPTFYSNSWNNGGAGGSNMWSGTATGTVTGLFRMHNARFVEYAGSNASFYFAAGRMLMDVENMILDHQGDSAGANASIGAAFGTLKNTYIVKANAGITATNGTNFATFDGIYYVGNYQSTPQHKFSMPDGFTLDGYQPQVTSSQFLGGFNNATLEIYSNINLTTAGWGLNDLKTKYQRYGGPITLQFPRRVTFEFNDSTATNLADVTLYIKSGSTSIVNAVQAGDYNANTQALNLVWNTAVFSYRTCTSFVDTIDQVAQARKYGYIEQTTSYSLNVASYSQPFFFLPDTSLSGISEATAAAITSVTVDFPTKTVTIVANATYDQANAKIAHALAQTANSQYVDPRTVVGTSHTLATGWTTVVNTGVTFSQGTNITYWSCPTITVNGSGKITGSYANSVGPSTTFEFRELLSGTASSVIIFDDATDLTKLFINNPTDPTQALYLPPSATATTLTAVVEYYGKQRETLQFPSNVGGTVYLVPKYAEDVGITETNLSTVLAYTQIENDDKWYDRTAAFRLTEQGIKVGQIATRNGTAVDTQAGFNIVINDLASQVYSLSGSVFTLKSDQFNDGAKFKTITLVPPATLTAFDTEVINANVEDAVGNSSVTLAGGDGTFELWKITTATATADYATGTKIGDFTNEKVRFIGITGFDLVGVDINSNIRRRCSMAKGVYPMSFYVGDQIQLAQAPQVIENGIKLDLLQVDIDDIKGTGFTKDKHSLTKIWRIAKWAASVASWFKR